MSLSAAEVAGPLEQSYRQRSATFRAACETTRLTRTHWHIAIANGLGWGFDGMDGVIFALATPLVIRDFGVTLPKETEIRVWDSTAETRFIVLPMRPAGTERWSEERLAELVTRDAMIGTGLAKSP